MMSGDRDAHTGIPYRSIDNPGNFAELKTKTEAMAKICYQIFTKQKDCVNEYQALLKKQNKLQEDLARAKRESASWAEKCREHEFKISGLQKSISSYHARLSALEAAANRVNTIETTTADTEDRLNTRLQQLDEQM
eukprot:4184192-Amphidinium_carterae.1